jgi:hypothetical protein
MPRPCAKAGRGARSRVRHTRRVLEDLWFRGRRVDALDIPAGTERSDRRRRWYFAAHRKGSFRAGFGRIRLFR